jgi:hypothetical protein
MYFLEGGTPMDPISLILAAQDTAEKTLKDAYAALKALIKKRFEKKPQAELTLAEYEEDADTWEKPLEMSLVEAGVDQDEAVVRQAEQVMKLVHPQQASQGKYNVQIGEGKGIVIGDHAQVTQTISSS